MFFRQWFIKQGSSSCESDQLAMGGREDQQDNVLSLDSLWWAEKNGKPGQAGAFTGSRAMLLTAETVHKGLWCSTPREDGVRRRTPEDRH